MDIVIPFVTCKDKVWMKNLMSFTKPYKSFQDFQYTYFYDYGTLKYVLRGIDKFIPYVDNVFLVVSNIEQIPDYVDKSKVKIVLHKDFIPEEYLPTFQANTIEMFMYNIPGLGEEFLYFNDDMIPVSSIPYEKLFKDGLPCINFIETPPEHEIFYCSFFEAMNSVRMCVDKNLEYTGEGLCPVHGPVPYLKSECLKAASYERHKNLLTHYTSTFRSQRNLNQYYWCDILYFLKKYNPSDIKVEYITTREIDDDKFKNISSDANYLCINDWGSDKYPMSKVVEIIKTKMDTVFPDKCKYEKYE